GGWVSPLAVSTVSAPWRSGAPESSSPQRSCPPRPGPSGPWFADGPRLAVNSCRGPLSLEASTAPPFGPATPRAPQLPSTTLARPRAAAPPLGSTGGLADDGVGALVNGAPRVRRPFVRRTDGTYPHDLRVLRCPAPPWSGSASGWIPSDPPSPLGGSPGSRPDRIIKHPVSSIAHLFRSPPPPHPRFCRFFSPSGLLSKTPCNISC